MAGCHFALGAGASHQGNRLLAPDGPWVSSLRARCLATVRTRCPLGPRRFARDATGPDPATDKGAHRAKAFGCSYSESIQRRGPDAGIAWYRWDSRAPRAAFCQTRGRGARGNHPPVALAGPWGRGSIRGGRQRLCCWIRASASRRPGAVAAPWMGRPGRQDLGAEVPATAQARRRSAAGRWPRRCRAAACQCRDRRIPSRAPRFAGSAAQGAARRRSGHLPAAKQRGVRGFVEPGSG